MTDPRITKGCELLVAYEAGCLAQIESTEDRDELEQRHDDLQEFLADNADFFLRDLPARVAELEEGLNEVSRFTPEMAENLANWIDGKSPHDVAQSGLRRLAENLRRAASLLSDSKAGEPACDGPYTPITVDGATAISTPPEASDDLVERALGLLRDQVVTFCFLIESRDDVSNEVKQRSKGAREAVYAMGRTISALRPIDRELEFARTREGEVLVGYNPRSEEGGWVSVGTVTKAVTKIEEERDEALKSLAGARLTIHAIRYITGDVDDAPKSLSALRPMPAYDEGNRQRINGAIDALLAYQQADMDGIMVLASRQAIHEVTDALLAMLDGGRDG